MLIYLLLAVIGFFLSKWFGAAFFPLVYFYFQHQKKIKNWWKSSNPQGSDYAKHLSLLMGYAGGLDGKLSVTQEEFIRSVLHQFSATESAQLMNWVNKGQRLSKGETVELLSELAKRYSKRGDIKRNFLEVVYLTLNAGQGYSEKNTTFLQQMLKAFALDSSLLNEIENAYSNHSANQKSANKLRDIEDAYEVLGVSMQASIDEIKLARKRLLNKYHPDKLAQIIDEEGRKIANSKVDTINKSYKLIQNYRGFV